MINDLFPNMFVYFCVQEKDEIIYGESKTDVKLQNQLRDLEERLRNDFNARFKKIESHEHHKKHHHHHDKDHHGHEES